MRVNVSDLQSALRIVRPVLEKRATLPVLKNILLQDNSIIGTDLETWVIAKIPNVTFSPRTCVDGAVFQKKIDTLIGEVEYIRQPSTLVIKGENSTFRFPLADPEDFPEIPDKSNLFEMSPLVGYVHYMLDVMTAAGKDTTESLRGVYLKVSEYSLDIVATDAHRLHLVRVENRGLTPVAKTEYIIPPKAVKILSLAALYPYKFELYTRLIEGHYPKYQDVIPTEEEIEGFFITHTKLLKEAVDMVYFEAPLVFEVTNGSLKLSCHDPDEGESEYVMTVEESKGSTKLAVNARYLIDAIKFMGTGFVKVSWINEDRPIRIDLMPSEVDTGAKKLALIMPMRI
ncbi:MAG: DNA polymerase III subunit beta [Alishewanella aestuarii]